ncbi:DUF6159 family protein [Natronobeatus ordinarius]|uniref:DUF6159 family protein n=1 Tax=Natronobeatus ordinarius TaxID=2963433 RepID=UPI0020CD58B5|nr:DUF6159 family protein [Natronobeatus ordinarius]
MSSTTPNLPGGASNRSGTGFFGKFKTGLKLSKDSLGVIRDHPKLLVFPAMGALSSLAFWIVFLLPLVIAQFFGSGIEYVVLFFLYFVTTFMATFFTAGLVFAVNQAFHGEEPSVREGLQAAWQRKGPILVWSAIAATVSVILKKLEESDHAAVRILSSLFALGWTVMTFFMVPVIVFEEVTVKSMFTRSAETFRDTWGESMGVGLGVTLIQVLMGIVGVAIAVVLSLVIGAIVPVAGIVLGIFLVGGALVLTYLVGQTVWAITKTALYVYAAEDRVPEQFENFDFETLEGRTERAATPGKVKQPKAHLDD